MPASSTVFAGIKPASAGSIFGPAGGALVQRYAKRARRPKAPEAPPEGGSFAGRHFHGAHHPKEVPAINLTDILRCVTLF